MKPIRLNSSADVAEVAKWWQSLGRAQQTLLELPDAEPGVTPVETELTIDRFRLLRYQPERPAEIGTPLLISYALVNRFTIADLQEDKSLVARLLDQGFPVYVMDWGYPRASDRMVDLDTYVNDYMHGAVQYLCAKHRVPAVNVLGICQGGTLALTYTAIHPELVKNLVAMVTPVDFQTENDRLSHMVQDIDVAAVVHALGNLPGAALNANFNALQPFSLNVKKWLGSAATLQDPATAAFFLRMERWINDSPDQAGQAYLEFIKWFYQENRIVTNTVTIGDFQVDYKAVSCPVLNIYGSNDHLVPPESSRALRPVIGSRDYTEIEVPTGHIGMYVSRAAGKLPERTGAWLKQRA